MHAAVSEISKRLMWAVAILSICGLAVSAVSLQRHYATSKSEFCDIGETLNCDIVNRSEYSSILGIPVALIGILGYAALAVLATVYRERVEAPSLLFCASGAGLIFALYLTYVEGHILGVWCILCLISLALIMTTTVLSGLIWWRRDGLR